MVTVHYVILQIKYILPISFKMMRDLLFHTHVSLTGEWGSKPIQSKLFYYVVFLWVPIVD